MRNSRSDNNSVAYAWPSVAHLPHARGRQPSSELGGSSGRSVGGSSVGGSSGRWVGGWIGRRPSSVVGRSSVVRRSSVARRSVSPPSTVALLSCAEDRCARGRSHRKVRAARTTAKKGRSGAAARSPKGPSRPTHRRSQCRASYRRRSTAGARVPLQLPHHGLPAPSPHLLSLGPRYELRVPPRDLVLECCAVAVIEAAPCLEQGLVQRRPERLHPLRLLLQRLLGCIAEVLGRRHTPSRSGQWQVCRCNVYTHIYTQAAPLEGSKLSAVDHRVRGNVASDCALFCAVAPNMPAQFISAMPASAVGEPRRPCFAFQFLACPLGPERSSERSRPTSSSPSPLPHTIADALGICAAEPRTCAPRPLLSHRTRPRSAYLARTHTHIHFLSDAVHTQRRGGPDGGGPGRSGAPLGGTPAGRAGARHAAGAWRLPGGGCPASGVRPPQWAWWRAAEAGHGEAGRNATATEQPQRNAGSMRAATPRRAPPATTGVAGGRGRAR